jgi:hypothetical protein
MTDPPDFLAGGCFPDPDCFVTAQREDAPAISGEGSGAALLVPLKSPHHFALKVPQRKLPIGVPCQKQFAIWGERN